MTSMPLKQSSRVGMREWFEEVLDKDAFSSVIIKHPSLRLPFAATTRPSRSLSDLFREEVELGHISPQPLRGTMQHPTTVPNLRHGHPRSQTSRVTDSTAPGPPVVFVDNDARTAEPNCRARRICSLFPSFETRLRPCPGSNIHRFLNVFCSSLLFSDCLPVVLRYPFINLIVPKARHRHYRFLHRQWHLFNMLRFALMVVACQRAASFIVC